MLTIEFNLSSYLVLRVIDGVCFLQHVYNKDDFFDTLSCNSLNRGAWNGRAKYSERMRVDTEVRRFWFSIWLL